MNKGSGINADAILTLRRSVETWFDTVSYPSVVLDANYRIISTNGASSRVDIADGIRRVKESGIRQDVIYLEDGSVLFCCPFYIQGHMLLLLQWSGADFDKLGSWLRWAAIQEEPSPEDCIQYLMDWSGGDWLLWEKEVANERVVLTNSASADRRYDSVSVSSEEMWSSGLNFVEHFPQLALANALILNIPITAQHHEVIGYLSWRPHKFRLPLVFIFMACQLVSDKFALASYEKRTGHFLEASEERYQAFIANSSEGVWRIDFPKPIDIRLSAHEQAIAMAKTGIVAECNIATVDMMGYDYVSELIGLPMMRMFLSAGLEGAYQAAFNLVKSNYRLHEHEIEGVRNDGSHYWMQLTVTGIIKDKRLTKLWAAQADITERKEHLRKLEYQVNHDLLTGIPNRNKLYSELELALKERNTGMVGVYVMDLNRFKEINETLGHNVGDELLIQFAEKLDKKVSTAGGTVARLGGDEFCVMFPALKSDDHVEYRAKTLVECTKEPISLMGIELGLGASIGVAVAPRDGNDVNALMRCAEVAMYQAKPEGCVYRFYKPEFDRHNPKRLALITDLNHAIREGQLHLHYQPKISVRYPQVVGFEVLVRWTHPEHGNVPPSEFVPHAEKSELIHPLTLFILEEALKQWRLWYNQGFSTKLAINFSVRNLVDEDFFQKVETVLEKYDAHPGAIEIEITESAIMSDPDKALAMLQRLNDKGIDLAIDDFGTGYSSLAYLKKMPIQTLKIDLSFVQGMSNDEQDHIIVRSTVNLAHNLGLYVIAEGVEDKNTLEALREIDCDQAQGYYFSKPLSASEVMAWLDNFQHMS